jgi:glycosyltransferase involved in cell wall biosynthesis
MTYLTIIIPVYNEEGTIKKNVYDLHRYLTSLNISHEIILSEDGSSDNTKKILEELAHTLSDVLSIYNKSRLGKTRAIKKGLSLAKGQYVLILDADLSVKLEYIEKFIQKTYGEIDLIIGSRFLKDSVLKRSRLRNLTSILYNTFIRLLFNTEIQDHQCGFKIFNRKKVLAIISYINDNKYMFDSKLIILSKIRNYRVKEEPIEWSEKDGRNSKINIILDGFIMMFEAIKFKILLTNGELGNSLYE